MAMGKPAQSTLTQFWLEATFLTPQSSEPRVSAYRPVPTRSDIKAEEATRVAREFTEAAAERRQAQVARLRQARLEKEASDKAQAAATPPKKRRVARG